MTQNYEMSWVQISRLLGSIGEAFRFEYTQCDKNSEPVVQSIQEGILEGLEYLLQKSEDSPISERELFNVSSSLLGKPVYDYRIHRPKVTQRETSVPNRRELDVFMSTFLYQLNNTEIPDSNKLEMILGGIPYAQPFEDGNKRLSRVLEGFYCIKSGITPTTFDSRDQYIDLLFDYAIKQDLSIKLTGDHYVDPHCNSELLEHIKSKS